MAATYEPIATTTLGSSAASITFSSIPGTYTDLRLVLVSVTNAGSNLALRFNGDSGANYSGFFLVGQGSPSISYQRNIDSTYFYIANNTTASTFSNRPRIDIVDIFSYSNTSVNTSALFSTANEINHSTASINGVEIGAGSWKNTSAVTSIQILSNNGALTFSSGTTATLFGIQKAA